MKRRNGGKVGGKEDIEFRTDASLMSLMRYAIFGFLTNSSAEIPASASKRQTTTLINALGTAIYFFRSPFAFLLYT